MTNSNEQALAAAKQARVQKRDQLTVAESVRTAVLAAVTAAAAAKTERQREYDNARTLDDLERSKAALDQATSVHVLAARDVQAATQAHAQAVAELQAADASVASAVAAINTARAEEIAVQVVAAHARLTELGTELRAWIPDAFHQPLNSTQGVSATVQRALDLTAPAHHELQLHKPLYELRHELPTDSALARRRTELLRDGTDDPRAA